MFFSFSVTVTSVVIDIIIGVVVGVVTGVVTSRDPNYNPGNRVPDDPTRKICQPDYFFDKPGDPFTTSNTIING